MFATKSKTSSRGAEMKLSRVTGITKRRILWRRRALGGAGQYGEPARAHVDALGAQVAALRLRDPAQAQLAQVPPVLEVVHEFAGQGNAAAAAASVAVRADPADAVAEECLVQIALHDGGVSPPRGAPL